jgi:tryptophan 2,3-dioxygenase
MKKTKKSPAKSQKWDSPPPGCPMHAGPGSSHAPTGVASTDLTYNDYLKIEDLLKLQIPQSEPAHHDEMLFIVIHQAYELWFKLILHEMEIAMEHMDQGNVLRAHHFMKRIVEILKLLVQQIHILETMSSIDFLEFRDRLMPASGFQSTQFREVEFLAGLQDEKYLQYFKHRPEFVKLLRSRMDGRDLRGAYYDMIRKLGYKVPREATKLEKDGQTQGILNALRPIYQKPEEHLSVYLLSESLVDFDQYLSLWREHHVRVVERVIGFKRGTGGSSGVEYLRSTTTKKCFPLLWEVRSHLEKNPPAARR